MYQVVLSRWPISKWRHWTAYANRSESENLHFRKSLRTQAVNQKDIKQLGLKSPRSDRLKSCIPRPACCLMNSAVC